MSASSAQLKKDQAASEETGNFAMPEKLVYESKNALTEKLVREISAIKKEPDWMLTKRLEGLKWFKKKPMPAWGADLSSLDFNAFRYYLRPTDRPEKSWDEIPADIKETFDRLGVPQAEKKFLAGVGAQYESESVYHNLSEQLSEQGVVYADMDTAVKKYPDLVKKYFGTIVPAGDNKFAALNTSVWSGGSFVYVPPGVHIDLPLQAYFRINAERTGQFERTLIIADEGSFVHYIEGCTAPRYSTDSLHSAVVEIVVKQGARVRYTTVQNWSKNVFNLVTKRAQAFKNATMEWVDGNLGSKVTMKYPSVYLMEEGAHAEILSLALAGDDQIQDAGGKVIHVAPNTTSNIVSKSVSIGGGQTSYRGLVEVMKGAKNAHSKVQCDALLLDKHSKTDTYPTMKIHEDEVTTEHEATVGKIGEEQLFYLTSRGVTEEQANAMIVNGFVEPIVKTLPMEYAVELNRLIELNMEGSVG